jgi:hypothetical protein
VLGLLKLGDIGAGVLEGDELATAGQRDGFVKRTFPNRDQPSRCSLIRRDAVDDYTLTEPTGPRPFRASIGSGIARAR